MSNTEIPQWIVDLPDEQKFSIHEAFLISNINQFRKSLEGQRTSFPEEIEEHRESY